MPAPKVPCRKCQKLIARTGIRRHEQGCGKKKGPRVACPECGLTFQDNQGLKSHSKDKHSGETYPCSKCDEVFDSNDKRRNHFNKTHTDKFRCQCGQGLASTQNLQTHIDAMIRDGKDGHEPMIKTVVGDPESGTKRKAETMDPLDAFLHNMGGRLKNFIKRMCQSEQESCTTTRLSCGLPGEENAYCSNHRDEVPGVIYNETPCRYIKCLKGGDFMIAGFRFCAEHRDVLVSEGLPQPDLNISFPKDYSKKCREDGCGKRATHDGYAYCATHSPTGTSDDKRVCEEPGCDVKRPAFGYPGKMGRWCGEHKKDGMCSHVQCVEPGCETGASYGPPGGTASYCVGHKKDGHVLLGASICAMACCSKAAGGLQARFYHPEHRDETSPFYKKRICCFGRRVLIEGALMMNDIGRLDVLMTHFKMNRVLTLNAQSAFRFECESKYHKLLKHCVSIVFDDSVEEGPKVLGTLRPDIFYKWCNDGVNFGIHIEYDETTKHEDDPVRLKHIAEHAQCFDRVYVIRVQGGDDTKNPVCERVLREHYSYFKVTSEGSKVASKVADAVVERIKWIERGLEPCESRPSKIGI